MPFTDERELQEIAEVLASGYLTQGQKVYVSGQLPNSHAAFTRAMTLPLYHQMTDDDLNAASACLREAIAAQRR